MAGVILANFCDEALTFHHDGQLVGFCLDDPDEPFGDDFQTRLAEANGDKWWVDIETHVDDFSDEEKEEMIAHGACGPEDDAEDGADEYVDDAVVAVTYGLYGDYCRMVPSQRVSAIMNVRSLMWRVLDIDGDDWNPGDDIVIACMRQTEGQSPEVLLAWVEEQYRAATREYKDHMHAAWMRERDANVYDLYDLDELAEIEDKLRTWSERGYSRNRDDRHDVRYGPRARIASRGTWDARYNHPGTQRQRRRNLNHESHCPKYGRQDVRHEFPRREAKAERHYLSYKRAWETWVRTNVLEQEEELLDTYSPLQWDPYHWEVTGFEESMSTYELEWYYDRLEEYLGAPEVEDLYGWLKDLDARGDAHGWPVGTVPQGKVIVEIDREKLEQGLIAFTVMGLRRVRRMIRLSQRELDNLAMEIDYPGDGYAGYGDDYFGDQNIFSDDDRFDDDDRGEGYTFAGYNGPENPPDDEEDNFPPLTEPSFGTKVLIRRGTPRSKVAHLIAQ